MLQELLYIRSHKVSHVSRSSIFLSLVLGTPFLESAHAHVFQTPPSAGRRQRRGPGRRGRLARVRAHPSGRGRSPLAAGCLLQQRRGAVDQRSRVRVPPSGRGRAAPLAVSYPRQCREAAPERRLAHVHRPGRRGPQITGGAGERTLRRHCARGLALAGTRREVRAATVAARDRPRPPENKSNRADDAEVGDHDLLPGHSVHRGASRVLYTIKTPGLLFETIFSKRKLHPVSASFLHEHGAGYERGGLRAPWAHSCCSRAR
jgi:hypothetical protein